MTTNDAFYLAKNLKTIENLLFNWSKITEKYPLIIRNGETGAELDAWQVIESRLKICTKIVQKYQENA